MEESDGSPPQSLCMIRAAELFPKPQMEKEDTELTVPFQELAGESVKYLGRTDDGILALSNYRIFLLKTANNSETSVPLSLIESVQIRDLFHLIISCKDASTVKCSFETAEQCSESHRRIQLSVGVPETLESLFAFPFCSWTCDGLTASSNGGNNIVGVNVTTQNGTSMVAAMNGLENLLPSSACSVQDYSERLQRASHYEDEYFMREVERLGFDLKAPWRISYANKDFKLCASYPQKLLVPSCISDDILHKVANFRGSRRLPAVVWRHRKSGAVIARCSQPEVGWLGWRNAEDEKLLKALADACAFDRGEQTRRIPSQMPAEPPVAANAASATSATSSESSPSSPDSSHEEVPLDEVRKVLIVDARSYTSAVTNRARGGGCECIEYYPCAEIEFMNLGNIHAIRKSFHALRQLCASPADVPNWLTLLEKTMWFQHLSGLLAASMTVCHAIEKKGRPVLVHCSDGWDRTPQLVATAQLCLDPYYRTVEGFRILVEREWLSFGHKFADRCGHGPGSDELNERCPVFLQWLDLVHQIHKKFPCSFEFSMGYLIKLAQHSHSTLFGTFLCNTLKERIENAVFERTFSVWPFLSGPMYKNPLYLPNREKVLWPAHNLRDMELWTEVYLGSLGNENSTGVPTCNVVEGSLNGSMSPVVKTRSYGDLITASILQNGISRRSSDPNMTVDPNLTLGSNSENTSVADIQSEREDSPDIIANLIHDTTRKLQNLTIELNTPDDDENFAITQNFENNLEKQPPVYRYQGPSAQKYPNTSIDTNGDKEQQQQQTLTNESALLLSSPNIHATNHEIESESNQHQLEHQQQLKQFGCEKYTIDNTKSASKSFDITNCEVNESAQPLLQQNGVATSNKLNGGNTESSEQTTSNGVICYEKQTKAGGITIHKTGDIDMDMMQSIDLSGDPFFNTTNISTKNGLCELQQNTNQENLWHGSINTSTDTLVPIENTRPPPKHQELELDIENSHKIDTNNLDDIDGGGSSSSRTRLEATTLPEFSNENRKSITNSSSILAKVHNNKRTNAFLYASSSDDASASSSTSSLLNNLQQKTNFSDNVPNSIDYTSNFNDDRPISCVNNLMDESILILPEHQKLDISLSGKCETIPSNERVANATTQTAPGNKNSNGGTTLVNVAAPANGAPSSSYAYAPPYMTTAASQRRRRASSSNSRRDFTAKHVYSSRIRSLPMTPPGILSERPQIAFSCPDGLAHALSEQNIRLQQIVHEHKLREDALLREIHDMRMALLKKICPNCNNAPPSNDEQVDELMSTTNGKCIAGHKCCKRINCVCKERRRNRHRPRQRQQRRCCQRYRCSYLRSQKGNNDEEKFEAEEASILDSGYPNNCNCNCHIEANLYDDEDDIDIDDDDGDDDDYSSISACSANDNAENASVCSWEAVEDRSGPSSCTSSSIQQNAATSSVLWVPDHAVSRCTSCQTEFWLGRRKHHCRSCGQIFCADCSEFWAPLPDEKLFSPVRLCGPCYHAVTTRMQTSQFHSKSAFLQAQHINGDRNKEMTTSVKHTTDAVSPSATTTPAAAAVVSVTNTTLMTATSQA